ncbi:MULTISPECIES: fructose-bisphosphatase class II [unclassified Nocardia]|uniref:fructose-bisphosphatase class II n=1 Tax=unclassified Nocardia TaxID=2637762 RepID=UPI001CE45705|nr:MULTISPECIES: fructose-bisphosphatase class II [unclassified Nocardia]
MTLDASYSVLAANAAAAAVAAAYPFVGLGPAVKTLADSAAAEAITGVLTTAHQRGLGPIRVSGCEGARDSAPVVRLPASPQPAVADLYCDPLDGTLNAVRGGPRAVAVVAFTTAAASPMVLDDAQSVFGLGSSTADLTRVFDAEPFGFDLITDHLHTTESTTGLLNRDDNRALLTTLAGSALGPIRLGSRSGFRPTIAGPGWLAVGDTSITLPLEADLEFGRVGLLEAQIQSALHRSWAGLVVSRDRIRTHPGGPRSYLEDYLRARAWYDPSRLRGLFTTTELGRFAAAGIPLDDLTTTLTPDRFGVGRDAVIAIAALSSPYDPILATSPDVLDNPVWRGEDGCLDVDTLTITAGGVARERIPVTITDLTTLPPVVRAWYRSLHWSTVPGAENLTACAEGTIPRPDTTPEDRHP